MKKLASLILALLLALGCAAVSADDVTGTWYATSVSMDGQTVDPSALGMEMTLTLNNDGTACMTVLGQEQPCTWSINGDTLTLSADGSDLPLSYDGTAIIIDDSGVAMKFERTASETFVRPDEVPARDISAFEGTWEAVKFGAMGMYLDIDLLSSFGGDPGSFDTTYVIRDGSLIMGDETLPCTFSDGLLLTEEPGFNGDMTSVRIRLLEGDMLEIEVESFGMTIICARAEAAELAA